MSPKHFLWRLEGDVGVVTLNRPERKNPLTFESYDELRNHFWSLGKSKEVKAVVLTGAGGNFCSGGDVHEIIGPLTKMALPQLLEFTRMTGDLVKAMRHCPQPIVAAVEGVCAGAGAILAMASDLRYAAPSAKVAFLFVRVGLAGCDMGACAILPRIIGQGRAAELLYTGRSLGADEGAAWGFFNRRGGTGPARSATSGYGAGGGADGGARGHEKNAACGMERYRRPGHRHGSRGAGRAHADQGLPPRLRSLRGEAQAGIPGRLMDRFAHYEWPFFEARHSKLAAEAESWAKENLGHAHGEDADAICKRLVQDLGCAGYLRHCVSEKPGRALDRRPARSIRLPRRTRRFLLRDAGAGQRARSRWRAATR